MNRKHLLGMVLVLTFGVFLLPVFAHAQYDASGICSDQCQNSGNANCFSECISNHAAPISNPEPPSAQMGVPPGGTYYPSETLPSGNTVSSPILRDANSVVRLICRIAAMFFWILMVLAIAFIIYAAYLYLFSGGSPEKVKQASHTIIFAVVAVVVAISAKVIPTIVAYMLGASVSACP